MRLSKKLIEQAYTSGTQLGLSVWCEDEAGLRISRIVSSCFTRW
jgi:hypothetical protein